MPKYANMLKEGMRERGHEVELWTAVPFLQRLTAPRQLKKWLAYVDQYIIFPLAVRLRLVKERKETLFVFADQALGPWIPLVADRPHVVHVHDFMALRSALNEFPQNRLRWTGKLYQKFILRGFRQAENFIAVSDNSQRDLHRFLDRKPQLTDVVYNGLNYPFSRTPPENARDILKPHKLSLTTWPFFLHVGGNQWYKNRIGVLLLYQAYCRQAESPAALLMVGAPPTKEMLSLVSNSEVPLQVEFATGFSNEEVKAAYSLAEALIFPSIAEGFGWPIAEALACGCLVITSAIPPMTEVGGNAAFYIPIISTEDTESWAADAAQSLTAVLTLPSDKKDERRAAGYKQVGLFDPENALNSYEKIYLQIAQRQQH